MGENQLKMASIEQLNKNIETKLRLIKFSQEQAEKSLESKNVLAITRQIKTLTAKVSEVHEIKVKIQELRIQEIIQQRIKYEKKLEESRKPVTSNTSSTTKLPKLLISKFNGTYTDWTRFWQQYEASIGAADIPSVTKFSYLKELLEQFSYLKELLEPKIRGLIEGLPLFSEGFERAKNILKTKYGKESEIVNAYVTNIMSLEPVHGANPNKISIFYEKLSANF